MYYVYVISYKNTQTQCTIYMFMCLYMYMLYRCM